MKNPFKVGDQKTFTRIVSEKDIASFESNKVHPVYSTFSIARDAEWSTRLFVLEMKEKHEEGIGTFINIEHKSPALIGEKVVFYSEIENINNHEILCTFTAKVDDRIIATGKTGQKILPKTKIQSIFESLKQ